MFTGEYIHQLDAKNRIRIPSKLRKEIGDEYYFAAGMDSCIYVLPKEQMEELLGKMREFAMFDREKQKYVRNFTRTCSQAVEDTQGRVVLSQELRRHAELGEEDKDLVFIGAINRIEIWNKKVYDEYFADAEENYDELLSHMNI